MYLCVLVEYNQYILKAWWALVFIKASFMKAFAFARLTSIYSNFLLP